MMGYYLLLSVAMRCLMSDILIVAWFNHPSIVCASVQRGRFACHHSIADVAFRKKIRGNNVNGLLRKLPAIFI